MNSAEADCIRFELRIKGHATAFKRPAIPSQPRIPAKMVAPTGLVLFSFMRSNG